ncbi:MAG: hypothetical protein WBG90_09310 [Saonia sp.]
MKKVFLFIKTSLVSLKSFFSKVAVQSTSDLIVKIIIGIFTTGGLAWFATEKINEQIENVQVSTPSVQTEEEVPKELKKQVEKKINTVPQKKKVVDKRSLIFSDAFPKNSTKKTLSLLIKKENSFAIDSSVENKIANELLNMGIDINDIFNTKSLEFYNQFYGGNPTFLNLTQASKYADYYLIGSVSIKTRENPIRKNLTTCDLYFTGVLVNIIENTKKPIRINMVKGAGFSDQDAIDNTTSDFAHKVAGSLML